jgi:hypothetical protein
MAQLFAAAGGTAIDAAHIIGIALTTAPNDPERKEARQLLRNTVHDAVDVIFGAILNLTIAGPIDYQVSRIPVLRGLPPTVKREVLERIVHLATSGSINTLAHQVAGDIGNRVANALLGD